MMKLSESPIIHFVRGVVLLATLVFVPGIAIFWNHLPKDFMGKPSLEPPALKGEGSQFFHENPRELAVTFSAPTLEPIYPPLASPLAEVPIEPAVLPPVAKTASEVLIQQVSWEHSLEKSPQDFVLLEQRIKALGATYYRLEKWGNRGELFRFSCFVTPQEPRTSDSSPSYEKYFQAIGASAVTVMSSVIAEIEAWKNMK